VCVLRLKDFSRPRLAVKVRRTRECYNPIPSASAQAIEFVLIEDFDCTTDNIDLIVPDSLCTLSHVCIRRGIFDG
jgi:hypothetical protein